MIYENLSKELLRRVTSLQLSPNTQNSYYFKDTVKQRILNSADELQFTFLPGKNFETELPAQDYSRAIFSDYYFGRKRIKTQQSSLDILMNSEQQIAWPLITSYYSAFFMATEISKLFGIYMTNFTTEDMQKIVHNSTNVGDPSFLSQDNPNYGFQVKVTLSEYDGFVKLTFYRKSPRPHVEVWKNIHEIVNTINNDLDDAIKPYGNLFLEICNEKNTGWRNPSRIRNDWNYRYSNYFSSKGDSLGEKFGKNLKSLNATMAWARKRTLQPHEENIVASLSFIYHCLEQVLQRVDERLGLDI